MVGQMHRGRFPILEMGKKYSRNRITMLMNDITKLLNENEYSFSPM